MRKQQTKQCAFCACVVLHFFCCTLALLFARWLFFFFCLVQNKIIVQGKHPHYFRFHLIQSGFLHFSQPKQQQNKHTTNTNTNNQPSRRERAESRQCGVNLRCAGRVCGGWKLNKITPKKVGEKIPQQQNNQPSQRNRSSASFTCCVVLSLRMHYFLHLRV